MGSLRIALAIAVALLQPVRADDSLRLELVASGFASAVAYVEDPVVPGTFLVVTQDGVVHVIAGGVTRDTPFLDLRNAISRGGERGLLGLAFPPDAAESGRVFVNFTDRAGHTVIARLERSPDDPLVADPDSRFDLQWPDGQRFIEQPYANHNGGHLAFGPDGCLYIGMGDGGSGNDPQNRAQSPDTLLGKMLRLDVRVPADDERGYVVPPDNPFLGREGVLQEIWAFGYRNPWRYSFDDVGPGATLALVVGDVGQGAREEIDYEPAGSGGRNYGWRHREGSIATPGVPPLPIEFGPLLEPLVDYGRGRGQAVTGGVVYRGSALPSRFQGRYFFGDYGSGRVWSLGLSVDADTGEASVVDETEHTDEFGGTRPGLASFARDLAGEIYLVTQGGEIYRIVPEEPANPPARARARARARAAALSPSRGTPTAASTVSAALVARQ
jgi:glucose/arabinose dehydrogenase